MMDPDYDEPTDWAEFPLYLGSPPPSPCHGFGPQDTIPGRLVITTEVVQGEEVFKSIVRQQREGRTRGSTIEVDDMNNIIEEKRLKTLPAPPLRCQHEPPVTPKTRLGGTGSRPMLYLVGKAPETFRNAKLPTSRAVLGRFLDILDGTQVNDAVDKTRTELKAVWHHHFGSRLVEGKELGIEVAGEEARKIIKKDSNIDKQIRNIWKDWAKLEVESRRPSRSSTDAFKKKEVQFQVVLDKPFNISKVAAELIIQESGLLDWREEAQHLRNQLADEQVGCPGPLDNVQKQSDTRKIVTLLNAEETLQKKQAEEAELLERTNAEKRNRSSVADDLNNNDDDNYIVKTKKKKKIDIMGKISITSDRANVSFSGRTMIAASTANALGVDVEDTNISKTTAWRKAQEVRTETAAMIKEAFDCPDKVIVHWDGKTLTLKGNLKSNRVCVYVTGTEAEILRKLLAVPETPNGTGLAEANTVIEVLTSWNICKEVIGIVFDTTASNTGVDSGACKFVEEWCKTAILWLACRHHIAELHIGNVVQTVTGNTKDPGVPLFRRLKKEWSKLNIDLNNLVLFDISSLDQKLQDVAKSVLAWATEQQGRSTWPREDYRELLELLIVTLGGTVPGFSFKMPGADHHARWMCKQIYYPKMRLLSNIFELSEEEQNEVDQVTEFAVLFYIKYWLQTPLPSSAARLDLEFMANVLQYRLTSPKVSFAVLQSCYRHKWYLTPQLVILALADEKLEDTIKEQMAKALFNTERKEIKSGKPSFPTLPFGAEETRKNMSDLVTSESWLIFQLLGLHGTQEWLQTPAPLWKFFEDFKVLKKFATNVSVCNDIAERGIHLMSDFISRCESEEQRQALFQCVEFHRSLVTDCTKKSLKLC